MPQVDLRLSGSEQDHVLVSTDDSRTISIAAPIALSPASQGTTMGPGSTVDTVPAAGCGTAGDLRAKTLALFEHGANIVTGTNQASPLPTKSKQLQGVLTMVTPWHADGDPCLESMGLWWRDCCAQSSN